MRVNLFTSLGALKVGLDILMKEEHVQVDQILGHGGLFKTKGVGQKILAGAIDAPVSVMETAGEGGAWGIALLASYMINKEENETLEDYLDAKSSQEMPEPRWIRTRQTSLDLKYSPSATKKACRLSVQQ